ncbi:hypothetical protein JWR98_09205 [Pseudomonas sp. MAFF 301380]|uniref:Uncharacterized protein n=1 Tax=Pseudomonas lactucae TaxID=2813360 RepID=A0A9X0YIC0_9PSED|nr:hypothetical protein [Pseudomonas lactucae]MBN2986579.1 hypothetical protein [Pseudomonas lactucae]
MEVWKLNGTVRSTVKERVVDSRSSYSARTLKEYLRCARLLLINDHAPVVVTGNTVDGAPSS